MSTTIGKLNVILTGSAGGFIGATKSAGKALNSLQEKASSFATGWGGILSAIGATAAIGGVVALVKTSLESIDALNKQARAIGTSTEALSRLQYAAKFAGVDTELLNASIIKMVKNINEAIGGSGAASDAFKLLGLSAKDLANLPADQQFLKIADAMQAVTNPTQRLGLAMDIFGKQGAKMLAVLEGGAPAIQAFFADADKFGATISGIDATTVERANDAFERMAGIMTGVANTLAIAVAPFLEDVSNRLAAMATQGGSVGEVTIKAFEGVVRAIAYASDWLNLLKIGWLSLKVIVGTAIAAVMGIMVVWGQAIKGVFNLFGSDVDTSGIDNAFKGMTQDISDWAGEASQAFDDWQNRTNEKAVINYFKEVKDAAKQASEATVEHNKTIAAVKPMETEAKAVKEKVVKQEKEDRVKELPKLDTANLVTTGSQEANTLINKIQARVSGNGADLTKLQLAESKKHTEILKQLVKKKEGVDAMPLLDIQTA